MSQPKIVLRNPMIWVITAVAAASPFILDYFLGLLGVPVKNNAAFSIIFPLIVIPLVWMSLWKLYLKSLENK
jgi:hypothetical protein